MPSISELVYRFFPASGRLLLLLILLGVSGMAQSPFCYAYDDANGLPSNEVYSMALDARGFIWIGSDAGLYRFDGVRYINYKCSTASSKSITGLHFSASGTLYCYNFQGQLFYLHQDTLKELKHPYQQIPNIACDPKGNLLINHATGCSIFNEKRRQWTDYHAGRDRMGKPISFFTKSISINEVGQACMINPNGLGLWDSKGFRTIPEDYIRRNPSARMLLQYTENTLWLFVPNEGRVLCSRADSIHFRPMPVLSKLIEQRKVNNVRKLADGRLWICTYKGVICYHPQTDSGYVLYPELSVTDALIDQEHNYWFSTLQSGLIRVPDLNFLVWNTENSALKNNRITHIDGTADVVYSSTVNGYINQLDTRTLSIRSFHTGENADIQSMNFDQQRQQVYFYLNNNFYAINESGKSRLLKQQLPAVKYALCLNDTFLIASSFGLYVHPKFTEASPYQKISSYWSRNIVYDSSKQSLWAASNKGLLLVRRSLGAWVNTDTFFKGVQVLSVDIAKDTTWVLTFDGMLSTLDGYRHMRIAGRLPDDVQGGKIHCHEDYVYCSSNKGLWIFDCRSRRWHNLNKNTGLASDNLQDLLIATPYVWLATGNGVQRLPLALPLRGNEVRAMIFLKKISSERGLETDWSNIRLSHKNRLVLQAETRHYNSNGKFRYAFRMQGDNKWTFLPGNIEEINIQDIPSGNFEIELKAVDHLGQDSKNRIRLKGYVSPPFWQSLPFLLAIVFSGIALAILLFRIRIKHLRREQTKLIEKLHLENELQLARQQLLRAQMNPHFIFNVLNSIKSYIYENDKKSASLYLSKFADLIRGILATSDVPSSKLKDELATLELYIQLEALLLQPDFEYRITIGEHIDTSAITVPSLIIQPFVENAFKHGLRYQEGRKTLSIDIFLDETGDYLQITIEDNGIGREKAAAANRERNPAHVSFAGTAIEKRLQLINKNTEEKVSVSYTDKPNHGGTIVSINVKL